jgi:hypothetical protein
MGGKQGRRPLDPAVVAAWQLRPEAVVKRSYEDIIRKSITSNICSTFFLIPCAEQAVSILLALYETSNFGFNDIVKGLVKQTELRTPLLPKSGKFERIGTYSEYLPKRFVTSSVFF